MLGTGQINFNQNQSRPKNRQAPNVPTDDVMISQGHDEFQKEHIKESEKNLDKFEQLTQHIQPLLKIKSIFPYNFAPNEVIIDLYSISLVERELFGTTRRHTILISDISDIFIDLSVFFYACLTVRRKVAPQEETITIKNLSKRGAIEARKITQGLITLNKQGIDISQLNRDDLLEKVRELGNIK